MASPAIIARRFVAGQLAPGGVIAPSLVAAGVAGVHRGRVPPDAAWVAGGAPVVRVIYLLQSPGVDQYVIGQRRLVTDPLLQVAAQVRVADAADPDEVLGPAEEALDVLLHGSSGPVTGGYVDACTREALVDLGPLYGPGSIALYRLGGLYRLIVREE